MSKVSWDAIFSYDKHNFNETDNNDGTEENDSVNLGGMNDDDLEEKIDELFGKIGKVTPHLTFSFLINQNSKSDKVHRACTLH